MRDDWRRAVESGDRQAVEHLVRAGVNIDSLDRYSQTALMIAALHGHVDVVKTLVHLGAKVDHTAKFRLSALMLAVINRRTEVVRVLVHAGADLEITGGGRGEFFGKTALDLALHYGLHEIVAILRRTQE